MQSSMTLPFLAKSTVLSPNLSLQWTQSRCRTSRLWDKRLRTHKAGTRSLWSNQAKLAKRQSGSESKRKRIHRMISTSATLLSLLSLAGQLPPGYRKSGQRVQTRTMEIAKEVRLCWRTAHKRRSTFSTLCAITTSQCKWSLTLTKIGLTLQLMPRLLSTQVSLAQLASTTCESLDWLATSALHRQAMAEICTESAIRDL